MITVPLVRSTVVAVAAVLLVSPATVGKAEKPSSPVTISATPGEQRVRAGLPCLPAPPVDLGLTNTTGDAVYADMFVTTDDPLQLSRGMFSSYLPAKTKATAPLSVGAAYGTKPGSYAVTLQSGGRHLRVPIEVVAPPVKSPGDNLLLGERADPSSTYVTGAQEFDPCGGVDGDRTWSTSAWNSASSGEFPDHYTVTLPKAAKMNRVDVYTHATAGMTDWDVRVLTSTGWRTVAAVRDNSAASRGSTFAPVTATQVQIVGLDSVNHDYSRIREVEAYLA
ncbi:MAG: hypothetical protein GEV10_07705 [Streptosporangiales bacterium]|nr:hypothetical protein [Streptosporangiales bacterium]